MATCGVEIVLILHKKFRRINMRYSVDSHGIVTVIKK